MGPPVRTGVPDEPVTAARTVLHGLGLGYLAMLVTLALWPLVFTAAGWRANLIVSGSMEPGLSAGDVVLSVPLGAAKLRPGHVVIARDPAVPARTLAHRVVRRRADGSLVTRGDANGAADSTPVPSANVLGAGRLAIPGLGLPAIWVTERRYTWLALWAGLTGAAALTAPGAMRALHDTAR